MKKVYFTVGPSQIFPTVYKHLQTGIKEEILSLNHRGEEFQKMYERIIADLKQFLKIPENYKVYFLTSGTEGMERFLENCVEKHSFHIITGSFGDKFYQMALDLKKKPKVLYLSPDENYDFKKIILPENTEAVCITHNDTSTGIAIDMEEIKNLKKAYPSVLIALDTVSSIPYADLDFKYLDYVFFSVQKGFGLPAGLGIIVVSDKAFERTKYLKELGVNIGTYHNLLTLEEWSLKNQTSETPNVLGIYLFSKILKDFKKIGLEKIKRETEKKAKMLYDFFDSHPNFQPFVKTLNNRSNTTLVINTLNSKKIVKNLKEKGMIIGEGYGKMKDSQIRIANFPSHTISEIEKLISSLTKF